MTGVFRVFPWSLSLQFFWTVFSTGCAPIFNVPDALVLWGMGT